MESVCVLTPKKMITQSDSGQRVSQISRYMSEEAQYLGKQLSLNCLMSLVRDNKGFAISIFLDSWCINI